MNQPIPLTKIELTARLGDPRRDFAMTDLPTDLRVCPLTGRHTRITVERVKGENLNEGEWPDVSDAVAASRVDCPFCPDAVDRAACTLDAQRFGVDRMTRNESVLFPNLAPYGVYSAVTIIGREHYTEVGRFDPQRYADAFLLSRDYLQKISELDEAVRYGAITQNHLPASGGTLVHPHLQVQSDEHPPGFLRELYEATLAARLRYGVDFWPALVEQERAAGERYVGATGAWSWLTMWAPQGMGEVWAVHPGRATLDSFTEKDAADLVDGLLRVQNWYRARCRNSFNLALYFHFDKQMPTNLLCRILARNSWQQFGRSDRSFFEVVLGEQVVDSSPEQWAAELRKSF